MFLFPYLKSLWVMWDHLQLGMISMSLLQLDQLLLNHITRMKYGMYNHLLVFHHLLQLHILLWLLQQEDFVKSIFKFNLQLYLNLRNPLWVHQFQLTNSCMFVQLLLSQHLHHLKQLVWNPIRQIYIHFLQCLHIIINMLLQLQYLGLLVRLHFLQLDLNIVCHLKL